MSDKMRKYAKVIPDKYPLDTIKVQLNNNSIKENGNVGTKEKIKIISPKVECKEIFNNIIKSWNQGKYSKTNELPKKISDTDKIIYNLVLSYCINKINLKSKLFKIQIKVATESDLKTTLKKYIGECMASLLKNKDNKANKQITELIKAYELLNQPSTT
ncbi:hypothetical protein KJ855_03090 [Patescibacteria group bacterium]|nr:hypothetical protein [Patescibacteria group bacterium]